MIEQMTSSWFTSLVDQTITLTTETGESIPMVVVGVTENPRGRPRRAPESQRIPFSVFMTGPLEPTLLASTCAVALPSCDEPVSLHVNRIAPVDGIGDKAWYQIIFC